MLNAFAHTRILHGTAVLVKKGMLSTFDFNSLGFFCQDYLPLTAINRCTTLEQKEVVYKGSWCDTLVLLE